MKRLLIGFLFPQQPPALKRDPLLESLMNGCFVRYHSRANVDCVVSCVNVCCLATVSFVNGCSRWIRQIYLIFFIRSAEMVHTQTGCL